MINHMRFYIFNSVYVITSFKIDTIYIIEDNKTKSNHFHFNFKRRESFRRAKDYNYENPCTCT
jgi:hypothetical protein